ncbi:MAG: NADH-quinone oxidoreductase subunit M, partial [Pseudomonadota bacterium]
HVQAPTAGSVILAGVLLKMGAYGFIRFSIPMLPEATEFFTPMVYGLSLVALAQTDMKKLIAYSSVAHMGYVTIGLFTLTEQGVTGALFQMLAHGVISGALFLCVGVIYDRMHTKAIDRYEGLANRMPGYAIFFMLFTMASVGLPGTAGFVGEFLVMLGAFQVSTVVGVLVVFGMVLGAVYMLYLYRRIVFGKLTKDDLKAILDIDRREAAVFAPLAGLTVWMGVYPSTFIDPMTPAVAKLVETHQAAMERAQGVDVAAIAADAARALGLL